MKNNPFALESTGEQTTAMVQVEQDRAVAEVQAAMVIAQRFPRDQRKAMDRILTACARPALAEKALYEYARGGSSITGPSIRLAEALAQNWGNIQFGIRELSQSGGESTVEAFAWDIETNTKQVKIFQVPHMRYTKRGTYALEDPRDVYEMVANQGARRMRACILGVIPGDVVEAAVVQVEETLTANADTSPEAIKKMLAWFAKRNVTQAQIEARIQRRLDSITPALMLQLLKIKNSLTDGMSKPRDWFELDLEAPPAPSEGTAGDQSSRDDVLTAIDAATTASQLSKVAAAAKALNDPTVTSAYKAKSQSLAKQKDSSAEQPPDEPEPTDAPDPANFKIPGGKSKGTPLPEASDRDLDYWRGKKEETIADPNANPKWVDEARAWLAACDEEQRRRSAGEQAEFFGDADEERF